MRILLVEDSIDIADAIETRLARDGHALTVVSDGLEGGEYALSGDFDVILLDINLPGQDGFAVLRSLRNTGIATPVLVMTARNQVADKVSLLDLGADDYIVKPFELAELSARVRALARRGMGKSSPQLQIDGLRMDIGMRTASLDDQPLDLGKREYDLLECLAVNAPNTVNKDQIVVKLFGLDDTGTPNAVELLVSRLRRKLEGSSVEIYTQRGAGYLLRRCHT
ncbi:response regulator transcription factor [Roseinatronobacter alkalisoli]|uniref:Response regulator transcription factor n=1 Tax=Roseinatronobacter alkalisoli TaxID=3028235 RepID=A0ABT5TEY5_9RHOB|nr:response regulator transcription factor [Roseinatronobacter sp. HJB301]MDD7973692.1 response regulator transcription factor [Roseinatronobacter sp. HJB301]